MTGPPALTAAQIAHAKTAIETKRETVSGMAEILGVDRASVVRMDDRLTYDVTIGASKPGLSADISRACFDTGQRQVQL